MSQTFPFFDGTKTQTAAPRSDVTTLGKCFLSVNAFGALSLKLGDPVLVLLPAATTLQTDATAPAQPQFDAASALICTAWPEPFALERKELQADQSISLDFSPTQASTAAPSLTARAFTVGSAREDSDVRVPIASAVSDLLRTPALRVRMATTAATETKATTSATAATSSDTGLGLDSLSERVSMSVSVKASSSCSARVVPLRRGKGDSRYPLFLRSRWCVLTSLRSTFSRVSLRPLSAAHVTRAADYYHDDSEQREKASTRAHCE